MLKVSEFFQGEDGCLSMSRLVFFLSLFPASYHVVMTHLDVMSYITTYAAAYVTSKHGGTLITAIGNKGNGNSKETIQDKDEGQEEVR